MNKSRRGFLKAGVLGSAALASGLPSATLAHTQDAATEPLSILILGGTGFIGPHMVREALRRGHEVTLFNRGVTNNALFPDLETIKGDRDNGLGGLKGRKFDAVIDNSGYVPRHVNDSAKLLARNVDHYLYISTIAVYASFSVDNDEQSSVGRLQDESVEEVTGETYGPLKALCEDRVSEVFDATDRTIIRPTYVCGPGDHTDRFSYWPVRTQRGGQMVWPGRPSDTMQLIDVRDLANFTIDCLDQRIAGVYNAVNPAESYTIGDLYDDCVAITGAAMTPVWISEEFAYEQGLIGGRTLPIWHPKTGDGGVTGSVSGAAARKAGLHNRPERETARDLLQWWNTLDADRRVNLRAGIAADMEPDIIAAWNGRQRS